jgi:putative transposase
MDEIYKVYPHNPPHLFVAGAIYMVTGATLYKAPILHTDPNKVLFCSVLFERAQIVGWELQAWAVLDNHYHFIARSLEDSRTLARLILELHSITAIGFNRLDGTPGRRVWYNYWDSCLTYEASYLARLNYVHQNPVKHGAVQKAEDYPFCSYRWFLEEGESEFRQKVFNQPMEKIKVADDF